MVSGSPDNFRDPDKTPFLQELIRGADGNLYFHMIIGGVSSSGVPIVPSAANESTIPFAQEVFIRQQSTGNTGGCFTMECSFSGGSTEGFQSGGGGNGDDPLANNMNSAGTGNRTGFPTRVIMKLILNDGDFSQVFLKNQLAHKPVITQNITASDIRVLYKLDMSNSAYNSNATAGIMTNQVTFLGVNAGIPGNFDANGPDNSFTTANAQSTNITGGRYTFVEGAAGDSGTFRQGTYTYLGGDDAVSTLDWDAFRNDAQNPLTYGVTVSVRKRSGNICKSSTSGSIPAGC
jgi:hypothetical protein